MNGHLDTGPVVDPELWTVPPFGGVIAAGRIYGRGIADMKAGVAVDVLAMRVLAESANTCAANSCSCWWPTRHRRSARTQFVLETRPELAGDAMISADAGSPGVARIGEKGFIWMEIEAQGKSSGSAHPHLGVNAIERLLPALDAIQTVADSTMPISENIRAAIEKTGGRSEIGAGETHTLTHTTVTMAKVEGGVRINSIPSKATAQIDIRMPPGSTVAHIRSQIASALDPIPHIAWRILDAAEPTWTAPEEAIEAAPSADPARIEKSIAPPTGARIAGEGR